MLEIGINSAAPGARPADPHGGADLPPRDHRRGTSVRRETGGVQAGRACSPAVCAGRIVEGVVPAVQGITL